MKNPAVNAAALCKSYSADRNGFEEFDQGMPAGARSARNTIVRYRSSTVVGAFANVATHRIVCHTPWRTTKTNIDAVSNQSHSPAKKAAAERNDRDHGPSLAKACQLRL